MSDGIGRMLYSLGFGSDMFKPLLGRKLTSVKLVDHGQRILFSFETGDAVGFAVEGDCCSSSWIEHLELPCDDVAGLEIIGIYEDGTTDLTDDEAANPLIKSGTYEHREHECLVHYQTAFRTAKGDIVLEYRNSSNGYYGGYLVEGSNKE